MVLRGPPVCARSHEGVAAVRWGVKRSEGAKAPFLRFATLWDLWRYASDVRAWCSASATSGMGLPAALSPRTSGTTSRIAGGTSGAAYQEPVNAYTPLRHNYPPRQPVRGQATAQPKIKPSTRPVGEPIQHRRTPA
ncbi:putative uncharacterized protein [Bifidobacterium longum subsp. longum CECT 7347]|nr:putative uncharacterized protein [Bifidobacterium longum subsp. longum CECT 7347]